jgi:hypothetical protein
VKKIQKVIPVCVTLASIAVFAYGAGQVVRHLQGRGSAPAGHLLIALAGAAGVLIGVTCFGTMDKTLYLGSGGED